MQLLLGSTAKEAGAPRVSAFPPWTPPQLVLLACNVTALCVDIRALWSLDHADQEPRSIRRARELLAFGSRSSLERLRRARCLHSADVTLHVVFDGDAFEPAWGPGMRSGSLARLAWRPALPREAYYDQPRWGNAEGESGNVVRVRCRARLVWRAEVAAPSPRMP